MRDPIHIRMGGYGPPTTGFSRALKRIGDRLEDRNRPCGCESGRALEDQRPDVGWLAATAIPDAARPTPIASRMPATPVARAATPGSEIPRRCRACLSR